MWYLNDDGAVPPLPKKVYPRSAPGKRSNGDVPESTAGDPFLEHGCWLVQLAPFFADDFDPRLAEFPTLQGWTIRYLGTMRVEWPDHRREQAGCLLASGDLYVVREAWSVAGPAVPPGLPPSRKIEILPRDNYAFYFTLQDVVFGAGGTELTIAAYRFIPKNCSWGPVQTLNAKLEPERAPAFWRQDALRRYHCGWVYNDRGTRVAKIEMGWSSENFRRAEIEIAVAPGLAAPLDNGEGLTLDEAFRQVGWEVTMHGPVSVKEPSSSEVWQEQDLHARMLELRSAVDLDRQWFYHVLIVPRFYETEEYGFGLMYDVGALDTNLVPREGLVVALEAKFPQEPRFGAASGQKLGDVPAAAFHNLIHELGHAMGLLHRYRGATFMQALVHIASQATVDRPFPTNLNFKFDAQDELRLRHHPDMWVRPGGAAAEWGISDFPVPVSDAWTDVSQQFDLRVEPLRRRLPLGAPVRISLELKNKSSGTLPGPSVLSLASGSVVGRVIGPAGQIYPFSAAAPLDFVPAKDLAAGASLFRGETLWRGPMGALFPLPGLYRIEIEAGWVGPGGIAHIINTCEVEISQPRTRRHERVAFKLIGSKEAEDLSLLLVFRTSAEIINDSAKQRIERAARLLHRAVGVKTLRPSLAAIEALQLARFNLIKSARLIGKNTYMTTREIDRLMDLVKSSGKAVRGDPAVQGMVKVLFSKAAEAVAKGLEGPGFTAKAEALLRGF